MSEPTESEFTVAEPPTFTLPEKRPFPATERREDGDVVPRPMKPFVRNVAAVELPVMIESGCASVVPKTAGAPKALPPFAKKVEASDEVETVSTPLEFVSPPPVNDVK